MKNHFSVLSLVSLHIAIINTILNTLVKKIRNLSTIVKLHSKSNNIDGSVVNGIREPILFNFILDKLPWYKVFCEPETIH